MEIWVNPACSKCRAATAALDEAGIEYTVRRYLDAPPTRAELEAVLDRLGLEPWHLARTGEPVAEQLGISTLGRAAPDFVRKHTGQVIGGVSPIAHPTPVPTYVDPTLRTYDEIWAAAGHPAAVFSTTYDELVKMTGAAEVEVD